MREPVGFDLRAAIKEYTGYEYNGVSLTDIPELLDRGPSASTITRNDPTFALNYAVHERREGHIVAFAGPRSRYQCGGE